MSKTIVITGGSDGLGKTLAQHLAKTDHVVILATTEAKLKSVAEACNCSYRVCDITDYAQVESVIRDIEQKLGAIDVLINNAGLYIESKLEENDSERIRDVIEVNLLGTINVCKAIIPYMKKRQDGLIININSQGGISQKTERSVYYASKWGVTGFTKCMQDELAKQGIRVSDVLPGMMKTDIFQKVNVTKNMANGLDTNEVARVVRFLIDTPKDVLIPEVGIKHINN